MQSSTNQQGVSERRFAPYVSREFSSSVSTISNKKFDNRLEELCWENGQLLVATQLQNGEIDKPTAGSSSANHLSLGTARLSTAKKDHTLEVVVNDDERITEVPAHVPCIKMTDCLDDPMNHQGSVVMQRNKTPSPLVSSHPYQHMGRMRSRDFSQQATSIRRDFEGITRLCRPSMQNELLNVDTRVNMLGSGARAVDEASMDERGVGMISPVKPTMTQEHVDKGSDAMLKSFSSHRMAFSPIKPLQNTHFNGNSGDAVVLNASHVDSITNLPGASGCTNSHTSVDINPASDLESVLLDSSEPTHMSFSCGSGRTPNKDNKLGEVSGNKKANEIDDFDSESEGSYDDEVALKKPRQEPSVSTKRTRAAETHNQSERKRRGRINEKLKALQELIPNANKTDKASVLSEAIDYLKKLRLQLQVMCCRSVSPVLISQGVPHLQIPLVATGNFGTQAGMGASVTTASFQSFPLPPLDGSTAQVCTGSTGVPELRAIGEESFVSTSSSLPSGIPISFGTTDLSTPVSFRHPFQI